MNFWVGQRTPFRCEGALTSLETLRKLSNIRSRILWAGLNSSKQKHQETAVNWGTWVRQIYRGWFYGKNFAINIGEINGSFRFRLNRCLMTWKRLVMKDPLGSLLRVAFLDIILIIFVYSSTFYVGCKNRGKKDLIFFINIFFSRKLKAANILLFHVYKEWTINAQLNLRISVQLFELDY